MCFFTRLLKTQLTSNMLLFCSPFRYLNPHLRLNNQFSSPFLNFFNCFFLISFFTLVFFSFVILFGYCLLDKHLLRSFLCIPRCTAGERDPHEKSRANTPNRKKSKKIVYWSKRSKKKKSEQKQKETHHKKKSKAMARRLLELFLLFLFFFLFIWSANSLPEQSGHEKKRRQREKKREERETKRRINLEVCIMYIYKVQVRPFRLFSIISTQQIKAT